MTKAVLLDLRTIKRDDIDSIPKAIITPEIAGEAIEKHNTLNRPLFDSKAKVYGESMKLGKWTLDGEPVIFSKEGILLDGQHRLYACWYYAKKPFETTVTLGVDKKTFVNIDTGKKRSGSDVLFIDGKMTGEPIKYRTTVWAAAKICIEYQRGVIKRKGSHGTAVTHDMILDFVHNNPELIRWVERAKTQKNDMTGSYTGPLAAVCFLANNKFPMKAESFMHGAITGESLNAGSPILALRRELNENKKRLDRWERIALIIHAYNLYVDNKEREHLKLPKGEIPFVKGSEPKWATQKVAEKKKPMVNKDPAIRRGKRMTDKEREAKEISYIKSGR